MAANATDYLENAVLQHTLGILLMPRPTALYVGLCTSLPDDSTPGTPVAGGGYVRLAITFSMLSNSVGQNTSTLEWAAATAPWGAVGYCEIWDALTAGNRLYWLPLVDAADMVTPVVKTINAGDIMRIPAGAIQITAD